MHGKTIKGQLRPVIVKPLFYETKRKLKKVLVKIPFTVQTRTTK